VVREVAESATIPVRLIHRDVHTGGLGGAVVEGMKAATFDACLVMDADLQHPPEDIPALCTRFASGDVDRPALRVGENQQQDTRQFYLVVPQPTSVHAPPPPIATRVNATPDAPPSNLPEPAKTSDKPAPGEDCASACKSAFGSCNQACDAATKSAACKSCDPDYKKCMGRCFE
jgi:glycosyltransferase involved in cell wall biosynthesis